MGDFRSCTDAPVVDVSGLFDENPELRATSIEAMVQAIERTSVFVATGMPGGDDFDRRSRLLLRFFEIDEGERRQLMIRRSEPASNRMYRGYYQSPPEQHFSHLEYFDIGPERSAQYPPLRDAGMFAEPNVWPVRQPVEGWRAAMVSHFGIMENLALAILRGLARAFDLPLHEVDKRFADGNSTLRLLRYPPRLRDTIVENEEAVAALSHDPNEPPMAIGRHTDGCCLSLLWQREPGLQGQGPDDVWYDVPCAVNSVSVHLGDMAETMTRGRLRATPHRVCEQRFERGSIGFFLEPRLRASCAPFDAGCAEDRGDLDTYAAMLLRRHARYPGYAGVVHDPDLDATL